MNTSTYRLALLSTFLITICWLLSNNVATDLMVAASDGGVPDMWYGVWELSGILLYSVTAGLFAYFVSSIQAAGVFTSVALITQLGALAYPQTTLNVKSDLIIRGIAGLITVIFIADSITSWASSGSTYENSLKTAQQTHGLDQK